MLKCLQLSNSLANLYIKISLKRKHNPSSEIIATRITLHILLTCFLSAFIFCVLNKHSEEKHISTEISGRGEIYASVKVGKSLIRWEIIQYLEKILGFFLQNLANILAPS